MDVEYDQNKSDKKVRERNLSFDEAINFEWETTFFVEDTRKDYSEKRFIASGYLNKRLHILCFTKVDNGIRVVLFRKANKREVKKYEEAKAVNK